ncbi:MAG: GNAT family N-acetyltransferase [Planctomycetota bacterium]|nr:MAG: GNAT family N-acetyltransferase [Planctomycetota bacterium]
MLAEALSELESLFGKGPCRGVNSLSCEWMYAKGRKCGLIFDPYNRRLKLSGISAEILSNTKAQVWLEGLGKYPEFYSKLIVYAKSGNEYEWQECGFHYEGGIPEYFGDGGDLWFWAAYGDASRKQNPLEEEHERIVELAMSKAPSAAKLPQSLSSRIGLPRDSAEISSVLGRVFNDYPIPLDEEFTRARLADGSHHFRLVFNENKELVALASAEIDSSNGCAELTDCVTLPPYRGKGLMAALLREIQRDLIHDIGIADLYTLARADEIGMNCTFSKLGWNFSGRLRNNCRMPTGWESMNIWCQKPYRGPGAALELNLKPSN